MNSKANRIVTLLLRLCLVVSLNLIAGAVFAPNGSAHNILLDCGFGLLTIATGISFAAKVDLSVPESSSDIQRLPLT